MPLVNTLRHLTRLSKTLSTKTVHPRNPVPVVTVFDLNGTYTILTADYKGGGPVTLKRKQLPLFSESTDLGDFIVNSECTRVYRF